LFSPFAHPREAQRRERAGYGKPRPFPTAARRDAKDATLAKGVRNVAAAGRSPGSRAMLAHPVVRLPALIAQWLPDNFDSPTVAGAAPASTGFPFHPGIEAMRWAPASAAV